MRAAGLLDTALINPYNSFWLALLAKRSFFLTVKERYHIIQVPPYGLMVIYLRLPCPPLAKRGSLTHSQALALSKRARDVTALRCSEPLRSKVGGASKPSPCCAGWDRLTLAGDNLLLYCRKRVHEGAGWDRLNCSSLQYRSALVVARMRNIVLFYF